MKREYKPYNALVVQTTKGKRVIIGDFQEAKMIFRKEEAILKELNEENKELEAIEIREHLTFKVEGPRKPILLKHTPKTVEIKDEICEQDDPYVEAQIRKFYGFRTRPIEHSFYSVLAVTRRRIKRLQETIRKNSSEKNDGVSTGPRLYETYLPFHKNLIEK